MKRFCSTVALALMALAWLTSCNDYNNSVQYATGATLVNIAPSGVIFGGPSFTLTVMATSTNGFSTSPPTTVQWNGQNLATTAVSTTVLTAVVPASLIAKPGTAYVNTHYQQSGTGNNGLSNSLAFLIYGAPNPEPTLTSISPSTTAVCASSTKNCSPVTITLTGTNFLSSSTNGASTVTYTGVATAGIETAISTSSITSTQIKAIIPTTYLTQADPAARINVINPPSGVCVVNCPNLGGGDTNCIGNPQCTPTSQTFSVGAAAPAAASATANAAGATAEETPAISADGRYVAYTSQENDVTQILLRDTCVGAPGGCAPETQTVSVAKDGTAGNDASHSPVISADGRYVAFSSAASNLVSGVPEGRQVYLRDMCIGASTACKSATSLISTDPAGALIGTEAILPSISSSGRYVAFVAVTPSHDSQTPAAKAQTAPAVTVPNSGLRQVFLRDTCLNTPNCTPKTTRISMQPGDAPPDSSKPAAPALSALARQIALADGKTSTVLTPTVPIDDRVFLAIPNEPK
jgi:trimeric autotransporter adhesin